MIKQRNLQLKHRTIHVGNLKKKKLIISFAIAYVDSRINGAKFSIEISFLIDKNL